MYCRVQCVGNCWQERFLVGRNEVFVVVVGAIDGEHKFVRCEDAAGENCHS